MNQRPLNRRALLRRLMLLGAGAAGYFAVHRALLWPTPKVSFAQGDRSGWIELPARGGLVDLSACIGWTRVRAVVDSGAQYSAIDRGLAQRLGLRAATPLPMVAFGVSGSPSLTHAVTLDADLGAFALRGLRAATLDLQPLTGLTRQPFSLLLGRDFLRVVTAEIDFPRGRAAFFGPGVWSPPPGAAAAPVRSDAGALTLAVQVEAAEPIEVTVDTGATGALALSEASARQAGLLDGRPLRTGRSVSLGGVSSDGVTLARELRFAGRRLTDVEVQIYRPAPNAPAPRGLLGLGVLRRFHLALDLAGARLYLIGPEQPPPAALAGPPTRFGPGG